MTAYGDSLTTGARCSLGPPEALAKEMRKRTKRSWVVYNEAINGETILQLLRRMDQKSPVHKDASFASVLIGTNDSKPQHRTSPDLYEELLTQVFERLSIRPHLIKIAIKIPPLIDPICSPYDKKCQSYIDKYNLKIEKVAKAFNALLVDLTDMNPKYFSDGVHFNNDGVALVAVKMADVITGR